LLLVDLVVLVLLDGSERHEVEAAGLADEAADGVRVGDARQLHDDPVGALRRDHRLRDAGGIDPVLDDPPDDLEVRLTRNLLADLLRLVFDPKAALQVEAQLRLDRTAAAVRRVGEGQSGNEIDDEGEQADDENEDRAGLAHRRRMIQGGGPPAAARAWTAAVRRRPPPLPRWVRSWAVLPPGSRASGSGSRRTTTRGGRHPGR